MDKKKRAGVRFNEDLIISFIYNPDSETVDVYKNGFYEKTIEANEKIVTIPLQSGYYEFIIYYKYNFGMLDGIKSSISIIYN